MDGKRITAITTLSGRTYRGKMFIDATYVGDLLAAAGWTIQDGVLRNAQGQAFVIEYLDSNEAGARVVTPWLRNCE